MKIRISWFPFWRYPRGRHYIPSLADRHGCPGSTSLLPVWGPTFPGQSLPLASPAPGRRPSQPAVDGVQCGAPPGGWCPRQQRSALCGRGWSSAGASHGGQVTWASWSWPPLTCSWGNLKSILYPDKKERLPLFDLNVWRSPAFPSQGSEAVHGLRGRDGVRDEHHQCHHWGDEEPLVSSTREHSSWDERLWALFQLHFI